MKYFVSWTWCRLQSLKITFDFPGFSHVEIGVTSDGNTIVCYHPAADVPYEFTQVRDNTMEYNTWILKDLFASILFVTIRETLLMAVWYFAADRTAGPPNKPSRIPRSGLEGSSQQGGGEQQGAVNRGAEQDVFYHKAPVVSCRAVSTKTCCFFFLSTLFTEYPLSCFCHHSCFSPSGCLQVPPEAQKEGSPKGQIV